MQQLLSAINSELDHADDGQSGPPDAYDQFSDEEDRLAGYESDMRSTDYGSASRPTPYDLWQQAHVVEDKPQKVRLFNVYG